jgi:hypothetical protein
MPLCIDDPNIVKLNDKQGSLKGKNLLLELQMCMDEPHCEKDKSKVRNFVENLIILPYVTFE